MTGWLWHCRGTARAVIDVRLGAELVGTKTHAVALHGTIGLRDAAGSDRAIA